MISYITKYGSTLYIGMDEVFQHHAHTFEKSSLNFVNSVLLPQISLLSLVIRVIMPNVLVATMSVVECDTGKYGDVP